MNGFAELIRKGSQKIIEGNKKIVEGGRKIARGVSDVQNSVSGMTDLLYLKNELKDKEKELVTLYADYGKACYEGCTGEDIKEAIDLQLEYIKEVQAEMEELMAKKSDFVFCTKCGKECKSEDDFCPKCGNKLRK